MRPLPRFRRLPDKVNRILGLLPRAILDRLEVSVLPSSFDHIPSSDSLRLAWASVRCALLKQCVYNDLYCCFSRTPAAEAIRSSLLRTGPMGFLTDLRAEFWHVREDEAMECKTWEESPGSNPAADLTAFRARQHHVHLQGQAGHTRSPWEMSVPVDEVPFGAYDIVISLDIAVPLQIRRRHPNILWVYCPTDPGTPTAKSARRTPPEGFDVTLTHMHRRFPVRPNLGSRSIDCPYSFQSPFSWQAVWPINPVREGVMVEGKTHGKLRPGQLAKLGRFGPVRRPKGSVSQLAKDLLSSRYYLSLYGNPLTGNGQVEAIMAGCLSVGDPRTYVQRSLFTPDTAANDFDSALLRISAFEADPVLRQQARDDQKAIAEYICFRRPSHQLLKFLHKKRPS